DRHGGGEQPGHPGHWLDSAGPFGAARRPLGRGQDRQAQAPPALTERLLRRGIGRLDATALVVGSMIGSGIFIVSAESARLLGSSGWLLAAWAIAGVLTLSAALSCAELAAMLPKAGG